MAAFTMAYTVSIIIPLFYCLLQGSISEDSRCGDRCCAGYKEEGGKCEECKGSYGENCTAQCPPYFYGGRCLSRCYCDINERCDPVYGCCPKTSMKCQQPDEHANNQRSASGEPTGADQGISTETLTGIIISLAAIGIMLIGSVYTWMSIRDERFTTRAEPESANTHEEDSMSIAHVNELCYDDIRESQMITDENCDDAQGIRYSDHLCRHPTSSTGHCQICEMANHGTERASEDYSKLEEGNRYNVLFLRSAPADVEVSCDATYVDENQYSPTNMTVREKEDFNKETTDKEKKTYHMYHILCKSTAENETGTRPNAEENTAV